MDRAAAAEHRMARLQATATALAQVMTPVEAGRAVLEQALGVFEAEAGAVYVLEGERLHPQVEIRGRRPPFIVVGRDDDLPLPHVVRTGAHRFFESQRALVDEYPLTSARLSDALQASVVLALRVKGRVFGAIALVFETARAFSPEERAFADAIAAQCALAIDRALLMEREHANLARAEMLAAASALLAGSLDPRAVLQRLAQLAVPGFADWCIVELVEGATVVAHAVAHADPARAPQVAEYRARFPWTEDPASSYWSVLRTGRPVLLPALDPALLAATATSPEQLERLLALGMRSVIIAPLETRGRTMGTLTLVWADSPREYTRADQTLFVELAQRASLALENAILYRDLRKAVEVRDDFLAAAGHELKTPLAALLMHVDGLQRALARDPTPPNQPARLEKAARAAKRLEKLIDELLDVSRITAGRLRLDPEPFELDTVVREVAERFTDQAATAGCELRVRTEPTFGIWDRSRIDQLVNNLIANAIKYGRGTPIDIEVAPAGTHAVIRVTDHGIGIPPDEQQRIFERFERVVQQRSFGGFGLGLWIARQIVDASGGTISVASEPGQGATFTVALPVGATSLVDG